MRFTYRCCGSRAIRVDLVFAALYGLPHLPLFGDYSQVQQSECGDYEGNNVGHIRI